MQPSEREIPLGELEALDDILASPTLEESSMDVGTLEGFLTALAIGPGTVMPEQWLPWVWDMQGARVDPEFESLDQANWAMDLLFRYYDCITATFRDDPAGFQPVYRRSDVWGAPEWAEGFLLATAFDRLEWVRLMDLQPQWFVAFRELAGDESLRLAGGGSGKPEEEVLKALRQIYEHWQPVRDSRVLGGGVS